MTLAGRSGKTGESSALEGKFGKRVHFLLNIKYFMKNSLQSFLTLED